MKYGALDAREACCGPGDGEVGRSGAWEACCGRGDVEVFCLKSFGDVQVCRRGGIEVWRCAVGVGMERCCLKSSGVSLQVCRRGGVLPQEVWRFAAGV